MSVPTQPTRPVPFAGGPLNASIVPVPEPLPETYTVGGEQLSDIGRYVLDPAGPVYTWHVGGASVTGLLPSPTAVAEHVRPAAESEPVELRPEPLAPVERPKAPARGRSRKVR